METKNGAKRPDSSGGKVHPPAKPKTARQNIKLRTRPKGKKGKEASFQAHSNEIHQSLENTIKGVASGKMTPESAREMLEKIKAVQTLLRTAKQELEDWLKRKNP